MIGQVELLKKLDNYTLETLPHAILFIGETGCGKHEVINYLKNKFNLDEENFDYPTETNDRQAYSKTISDRLIAMRQCPIKKFYTFHLSTIINTPGVGAVLAQTRFLKCLEDTGDNAYIILTADSEVGILETILNRCIKFKFEQYTENELKQVINFNNDLVYKVCKTPGQLKEVDEKSIDKLYKLCQMIIANIQTASYGNTLAISKKINYKEEYDKYDFNLFLKMLEYVAMNNYIETANKVSLAIYKFTCIAKQELIGKALNKENFMLNFLTGLWEVVR